MVLFFQDYSLLFIVIVPCYQDYFIVIIVISAGCLRQVDVWLQVTEANEVSISSHNV